MANDKALRLGFILSATDKMSRIVGDAVKKSTDKLSALERNTGKISQSMFKAGSLMVGAGAAVGAATFGIAKSTAEYGDAAWKNSQAVGMNVEDYQRLAYAAKTANVEETVLTGALTKLNKQIAEASNGSKTAGKVFTDLGIKLKNQEGKLRTPGEIFSDLSEIFERVEDGPAKAALAVELFGNSGTKLIPLLNSGADGLEALGLEAESLGLILSEEAARASEKFNDDLARVGNTVKGMTLQFGTAFMPTISRLIEKINEITGRLSAWIQENPKLVDTIAKIVFGISGLLIGLGSLSIAMGAVTFAVGKFSAMWRGVTSAVKVGTAIFKAAKSSMLLFRVQYAALAIYQKAAAAAQWLFNSSLLACPAVWIVAAIVAIGAAAYLLIKHWDKVKAFFNKLWENIKIVFAKAFEWIKNIFLNYTPHGLIFKHWDKISVWFSALWDKVKNIFSGAWEGIKKLFFNYTPHGLIIKHWDTISAWFTSLWQKVKNIFSGAWEGIKKLFFNYTPHGLIIKNWDNIGGWFSALWNKVKNIFFVAWEGIKKLFFNYTPHGLIIKHWDTISAWFTSLWQKVKNIFSGAWDNIAGMFRALNPVAWMSGAWDSVGNFFTNLKQRFFNWGQDIIKGLIEGITKYAKKAVDTVKNVGENIAGKFKNILGINSPSRLFMQYGINITEGLTGGIEKTDSKVGQATQGLALSATKGIQQNMQAASGDNTSNISNYGGESVTINYSPTINITGGGTPEEAKQDFTKLLRKNADEITSILERYFQNKKRLSFE